MARVDLFFGAAHVDRAAWTRFLANVVTPRFPEGFTSLNADGQWKGPRGVAAERTRVLIVYYRGSSRADARIDAVRDAYKRRFHQQSVLRADSEACVAF